MTETHVPEKKKIESNPKISEKKKLERMKAKDHEMVEGIFKYYEIPGGEIKFYFKKWPEDQIESYTMKDGERYRVPYMVAKHLNTNCGREIHEYAVDENGIPVQRVGHIERRTGFYSTDFSDDYDVQEAPTIYTVQKV